MAPLTRRRVLAALALGAGSALLPPGRGMTARQPRRLRAAAGRKQMVPDSGSTAIWGYDGAVPGPVLRVRQGGELAVRLVNELDQPTTVHWHGIRIDNRMDGVSGLTQDPVPPGGSFDYRFTVPDAGTFWYHPHHLSWQQMTRGLYGMLIVEEPEPPAADQDLPLLFDDWRIDAAGQIDEASLGAMMDWSHAGRLGNFLTVNGRYPLELPVTAGQRLRLLNAANARIMQLRFEEHAPQLIAVDGQPLPPRPLTRDPLRLAPGQRVDLMVDMALDPGASAAITEVSGNGRLEAVRFAYHPTAVARTHPLDAAPALSPNPLAPPPEAAQARQVELLMEGGAMGGLRGARFQGRTMALRELVDRGMVWALNGEAGRPAEPLFEVARGTPVALRMINRTAWPHAMHLHGHHVRVTARDGQPVDDPAWRDTILLERGHSAGMVFHADNPGDWLLHCHMLEHQAAGMSTWFRVRA